MSFNTRNLIMPYAEKATYSGHHHLNIHHTENDSLAHVDGAVV